MKSPSLIPFTFAEGLLRGVYLCGEIYKLTNNQSNEDIYLTPPGILPEIPTAEIGSIRNFLLFSWVTKLILKND